MINGCNDYGSLGQKNETTEEQCDKCDKLCHTSNATRVHQWAIDNPDKVNGSGLFKVNGEFSLCEEGYYCTSIRDQIPCPKGYFCPEGIGSPLDCDWQFFCPETNGTSRLSSMRFCLYYSLWVFFALCAIAVIQKIRKNYRNEYIKSTKRHNDGRMRQANVNLNTYKEEIRVMRNELSENMDPSRRKALEEFIASKQNEIDLIGKMIDMHEKSISKFEHIKSSVEISFRDMSLVLPNGKRIVDKISGAIKKSHITALMGSSGCGKTSFLTLLRGKAHYGKVYGEVCINNKVVDSLSEISDCVGFVPQDDTMYEELTVKQNVKFSICLFSRGEIDGKQADMDADNLLKLLRIDHVKDSLIGGVAVRGVSGGQRKRVSVAMELAKKPKLLLLDEPTSGLDSSSSLFLFNTLSELCIQGMTVVATVHQPRAEIFDIMDDLILLVPGGRMVYNGPCGRVDEYFSKIGYQCPLRVGIADFMLDVLEGLIERKTTETIPSNFKDIHSLFVVEWLRWNDEFGTKASASQPRDFLNVVNKELSILEYLYVMHWQAYYVTKRELYRSIFNDRKKFILEMFQFFVMGLFMSNLKRPLRVTDKGTFDFNLALMQLGFCLTLQSMLLGVYAFDKSFVRREEPRVLVLSLFIGKLLSSLPRICLSSCIYYFAWIIYSNPYSTAHLTVFLAGAFASFGVCSCIALVSSTDNVLKNVSFVALFMWAANGNMISIDALKKVIPMSSVVKTMSYMHLMTKLSVLTEIESYSEILRVLYEKEDLRERFDISQSATKSVALADLVIYGVCANLLVLVLLYINYDSKMIFRKVKGSLATSMSKSVAEFKRSTSSALASKSGKSGGPSSPSGFNKFDDI